MKVEKKESVVKRTSPTEEEKEKFLKDFQESQEKVLSSKYDLFDDLTGKEKDEMVEKSLDFIKTYLKNYIWVNDVYQGVYLFNKNLDEHIKNKDSVFDYPNFSFLCYIFKNKSGMGIESANYLVENKEFMETLMTRISSQEVIMNEMLQDSYNKEFIYRVAVTGFYTKKDENGKLVIDITDEEMKEIEEKVKAEQSEKKESSLKIEK